MVAAWMSAETGVGPSIASGSQVCSRNCADLPIAPMNSSRQISVSASACQPKKLMVLPVSDGACAKMVSRSIDAGHHEDGEDAEREAEIADAVDDEGLDRGGVGLGLVVPEADQQIAREADALPAEEQLREVVGRHQRQHGEGEQRQIREEPRPVRVLGHVADRIEVHERRDGRHHHQHHGGQRVDAQRPVDLEVGRDHPGEQRDALVVVAEADLPERDPGQHGRRSSAATW